jgi:hypothetical protein
MLGLKAGLKAPPEEEEEAVLLRSGSAEASGVTGTVARSKGWADGWAM